MDYEPNSNVIHTVAPATQYSTTFAFDAIDRTVGRTDPGSLVVAWSYDANNRRSGMVNPDGGQYTYSYDANGKMQYYAGPSPTGTVTLIWDFDDYMEIWS